MPYLEIDPAAAEDVGLTSIGEPLLGIGKSFQQLQADVKLGLLGRKDASPGFWAARVNDAYEDIVTSLDFKQSHFSKSFDTVAGQPLYLLGPYVRVIDSISYLDTSTSRGGATLDKTDWQQFRAFRYQTGDPSMFFEYNGVLVLWPQPTTVRMFVVDGRLAPQPLVEDADCPILPTEWHQGIVLKARYNALSLLMEWEAATLANNEWLEFVRRRPSQKAQDTEGMVVRSSVPRVHEQLTQKDAVPPMSSWRR